MLKPTLDHWPLYLAVLSTVIFGYVFWLRPILKQTPSLNALFENEQNLRAAFRLKFAGIKQKLVGAAISLAGLIVFGWDMFAPLVGGVDVTTITDKVPSWAWPIIIAAAVKLMDYFRKLADQRNVVETEAVAEAAVQVATGDLAPPAPPSPILPPSPVIINAEPAPPLQPVNFVPSSVAPPVDTRSFMGRLAKE